MKKEFLARFLIWIGIIGVAISLSTRSWILANSVEFMDYSKLMRYLLWWFDHAMRIFWSNLLVFTALDLGGKLSIFLTILLFMCCMCLGIYVSGGLGRHLSYRKLLTVACMPIVIIIIIYAMKVFNLIPRNDRGLESAFLMTFLSSSICFILMNRSMLHNILGVSIIAVFSAVSFLLLFYWDLALYYWMMSIYWDPSLHQWKDSNHIGWSYVGWNIGVILVYILASSFVWFPFLTLDPKEVTKRLGLILGAMIVILCASELSKIVGPWENNLRVPVKEHPLKHLKDLV